MQVVWTAAGLLVSCICDVHVHDCMGASMIYVIICDNVTMMYALCVSVCMDSMVVIAVLCWMFEGVTCVGLPVCIYLFPIVIDMFPIVISRFWYPVISFSRPASPLPFPFLLKIYSCSNGWGVFLTVPGRFQAYTPNARKNGKRKKSDNKIFVKVCEKKLRVDICEKILFA
jgi:hypothetical protein